MLATDIVLHTIPPYTTIVDMWNYRQVNQAANEAFHRELAQRAIDNPGELLREITVSDNVGLFIYYLAYSGRLDGDDGISSVIRDVEIALCPTPATLSSRSKIRGYLIAETDPDVYWKAYGTAQPRIIWRAIVGNTPGAAETLAVYLLSQPESITVDPLLLWLRTRALNDMLPTDGVVHADNFCKMVSSIHKLGLLSHGGYIHIMQKALEAKERTPYNIHIQRMLDHLSKLRPTTSYHLRPRIRAKKQLLRKISNNKIKSWGLRNIHL